MTLAPYTALLVQCACNMSFLVRTVAVFFRWLFNIQCDQFKGSGFIYFWNCYDSYAVWDEWRKLEFLKK